MLLDLQKTLFRASLHVFFRFAIAEKTVVSILGHVVEGNGMRKTSRLEDVHLQTAIRYTRLAGEHAEELHDELVAPFSAWKNKWPGRTLRRPDGRAGPCTPAMSAGFTNSPVDNP